jgi:hypothetical protein
MKLESSQEDSLFRRDSDNLLSPLFLKNVTPVGKSLKNWVFVKYFSSQFMQENMAFLER